MPINVTVKEPGSWIVRTESDRDIVIRASNVHDVSSNLRGEKQDYNGLTFAY
jgi:hypothetical protein